MSRIALLSYNNYYNRIYKKEASLGDYITNSRNYIVLDNINFNPADGVSTSLILGKGTGLGFLNWEQGSPDYLIVYNNTDNTIKSRWFILDEDRTRAGQYKVTLRRDLLADYSESLAESPLYIEKGYISDLDDPLLCNNEGLIVNQIKKDEILLKDRTQCPWLVMYLKKGALGNSSIGTQGKVAINVPQEDDFVYMTLQTPIGGWNMYQYTTSDYLVSDKTGFNVYFENIYGTLRDDFAYKLTKDGSSIVWVVGTEYTSNLQAAANDETRVALDNVFKSQYNSLVDQWNTAMGYHNRNDIFQYDGKIIKDSDGKYWLVTVEDTNAEIKNTWITDSNAATLKSTMNNLWNQAMGQSASANNRAFRFTGIIGHYRITLQEQYDVESSIDFTSYTGKGTVDANYDVICMPYGEVYFTNPSELLHGVTSSKERTLRVMNSLATALSSQWVLDLQLLPYCPCQDLIFNSNQSTIIPLTLPKEAVVGYQPGTTTVQDVLLVPKYANFSFDIEENISIEVAGEEADVYKRKYINDCTLFRLCSPNYNGLFEFNLAKNGGSVERFNVDITLRPFNPYIHLNPNFNFLYGYDANDVRGLVCGGDFSLGFINEAWNVYEIQNKNYQAIFDRQIQNLDINNAIARQEAGWQIAGGTVQGAAGGAVAGGLIGGG